MSARPILVIHSDDALATLLATVLAGEGYHVERVPRLCDALALLATRDAAYDLLLIDLGLEPGSDPYGWLTHLRAATDAPLVFCAPWPAVLHAQRVAGGATAILPTPVDLNDLRMLVDSLCPLEGADVVAAVAATVA